MSLYDRLRRGMRKRYVYAKIPVYFLSGKNDNLEWGKVIFWLLKQ